MEKWKDIKNFEGLYQISNFGHVKSLKYGKEKILKTREFKGYLRVGMYLGDTQKHFRVHRLVAEAFIPNINNLPIVNHKDRDRGNNHVDNLEWCTVEFNVLHKIDNLKKDTKIYESLCPKCRDILNKILGNQF